jgi:hypothetical protein
MVNLSFHSESLSESLSLGSCKLCLLGFLLGTYTIPTSLQIQTTVAAGLLRSDSFLTPL